MTPRVWTLALILLSVALNAGAQLLLRAAMRSGFPKGRSLWQTALSIGLRPGIIGGLACYGFSLLTWIFVLSRTEASFAYPFLGLGFVIVALAGFACLGESLSPAKIAGTCIIAIGIAVLASSQG